MDLYHCIWPLFWLNTREKVYLHLRPGWTTTPGQLRAPSPAVHVQSSLNRLLISFLLKSHLCGWLLCSLWALRTTARVPPLGEDYRMKAGWCCGIIWCGIVCYFRNISIFQRGKTSGRLAVWVLCATKAKKELWECLEEIQVALHAASSTVPNVIKFWSPVLPTAQLCLQFALLLSK